MPGEIFEKAELVAQITRLLPGLEGDLDH